MIIWIDGANGVGKSHVAAKLEELLSNRKKCAKIALQKDTAY